MIRSTLLPIVLTLVAASAATAQSPLRAAPSPRATSEVVLSVPRPQGSPAPAVAPAPTVIRLDYGQPVLRGRRLHTDSLVPYNKPWRTGANASTTLTTDVDILLGGATVPKGAYVLYTIPSASGWKLVVQKNVGQNPGEWADANDVARIDLTHSSLMHGTDALTMWLLPSTDAGPAKGEFRFEWGMNRLSAPWSVK